MRQPRSYDALESLGDAPLKRDQLVRLRVSVVGFLGFAEDDARGIAPQAREVAEGKRGTVERGEMREEVREEELEYVVWYIVRSACCKQSGLRDC